MRLKSLEIKGFKSFADKTIINFDDNITGIVGPNGCGKSNIVDSIRWVIGEQKISHLRSENLESLVFNGSKTRSSSGLAEVSLTFENTKNLLPTEFSNITITRKFYKSGESEYRLNDVQCRLKDIQNLFLDTGITTDSYAIIELGMVDDLIKDKDNSRRRMLEQAAGISIYKTRKKEARLKLDATEFDLNRIEDLLFEINNQLKTLESQAKKAEKYYEIKKDYRAVSIELAKASLEGFNLTYKELNERQQNETDKRIQIETEIVTQEAALEKERFGFIEKEKALQNMQHAFNELVQTVRSRENDKNLSAQRLEYLKERETTLEEFLKKAGEQLKGIEEGIDFSKMEISEGEKIYAGLSGQLQQLREDVDFQKNVLDEKRISLDGLRSGHQQIQRNQFEAEKKVAVADTSIQNVQRTIHQLEDEIRYRENQRKQITDELHLKEKELQVKRTDLEQLQQHQEYTKEQILQTQEILEGLRDKLADENRRLDAKKNEHDLLKSLIDSMDGYPESVKFLHNNPHWNYTAPILSDIIYVKEEYRAALENVLEQYLPYYVVNNLQEGLQAIHLLDENKKGKANFFLLDKFKQISSVYRRQPIGTIPAMSVVEVDDKYRSLAEHLLGNVFIADDEEALVNSNGSVILEKTGKYVKGEYSLSGGSVALFEGKMIGRAKNLEKLQDEIIDQTYVVNKLEAEIQARQNEVIAFNEDLRENTIHQTEQEIQQRTNQVFALHNKLETLHSSQTQSANRIEELNLQSERTHEEVNEVRNELLSLNEELQENADRLQQANNEFRTEESNYNEATSLYNEFNLQVTRQHSKINALTQELDFKTRQLNDLLSQVETSTSQLSETADNILQATQSLDEIETSLTELMRSREGEEKKLNEADQA